MEHIDSERLELYVLDRLTETDRSIVEQHILECRACQDALDLTDQLVAIIRQELKRQFPGRHGTQLERIQAESV